MLSVSNNIVVATCKNEPETTANTFRIMLVSKLKFDIVNAPNEGVIAKNTKYIILIDLDIPDDFNTIIKANAAGA